MPRRVTAKEMEAVLALDGPARFARFVKVVADTEEVWGLYDDGLAALADDDGRAVFPLWPSREYASACALEDFATYEARAIPLAELMESLAPRLESQSVAPGVFPTPAGKGVVCDWDDLLRALDDELEKYT